ncbi:MAG: hypothetical protein NVSMB51_12930 [Solirubrobacteraceae bacterium]
MARLLVICHASLASAAADRADGSVPAAELDVLVYGQGSETLPPYPGVSEIVELPVLSGSISARVWAAVRWIRALRRRRYAQALLAQPMLGRSRSRGALLAFGYLAGARAVHIYPSGRVVGRLRAYADFVAWLLAQLAGSALAAVAARIAERLMRQATPLASVIPTSGSVTYLRTDFDIAGTTLEAGGSAAHTEGVLRALVRRGHTTGLLSTGRISGTPDEVLVRLLPVIRIANVQTEILELLSGLRQGLRLLRHPRPTAFVYQRYSLNNLSGLLLARRCGIPLVLEFNASEVVWRRRWSSLSHERLATACERLLMASSDRAGAVSLNAAAELVALGADPVRLRVVSNGVEAARFAEAPPAPLPFTGECVVIAFCGLFYPWHGVTTLAQAFVRLAPRVPSARLLLIGDGAEAEAVRHLLQEGGVADRALMTGIVARDAVPGYLTAADILVSPHADVEGFIGSPIKVFEYLAAGRAIAASAVAQLAEVLDHERTALLVEPSDPVALAGALERLCGDAKLRERLGAAARLEAATKHSWDSRLSEFLAPLP